jgi:tRNA G37 N-methylase TrmD
VDGRQEARDGPAAGPGDGPAGEHVPPRRSTIDIFTLFPQMFISPLGESIIRRALDKNLLAIALHNIRDYTLDRHHVCDDTPYGGGGGMVMKPEPIFRAVETVLARVQPGGACPRPTPMSTCRPWEAEQAAYHCRHG